MDKVQNHAMFLLTKQKSLYGWVCSGKGFVKNLLRTGRIVLRAFNPDINFLNSIGKVAL